MINKFQQGGQASAQLQLILMLAAQVLQLSGYNVTDSQGNLDLKAFIQAVAKYGQERLGVLVNQLNIGQVITTIAQQGTQMARKGTKLNYLKRITDTCPEGTQLTYYKVGGLICSKCEAMQQLKPMDVMTSIKAEMFGVGGFITRLADATGSLGGFKKAGSQKAKKNSTKNSEVEEGWDNKGNYIVSKEGIAGRKAELQRNKTKELTDVPNINKGVNKNEKGTKISTKACPKCGKVHAGKCGSKLMKKKKKCACGTKIDVKKCGSKLKKDACGSKMKMDKCGSKLKKTKKHLLGGILEAIQNIKLN